MISGAADFGRSVSSLPRSVLGLCLVLILGGLGCAPKLVGPTAPSGYRFAMRGHGTLYVGQRTALVIRVQDASGQTVDGVPVEFQVDPSWADRASVKPASVTTSGGQAQTIFRATTTGVVPVTVRVENTTHTFRVSVMARSRGGGNA